MERKDLLSANGAIFGPQGKAIAARVEGRARARGRQSGEHQRLIAASNAKGLDPRQFHAMTRLDHNRALSQLAEKTGSHRHRHPPDDDLGQPLLHPGPRPRARHRRRQAGARPSSTRPGTRETFIPTVQQRGAAIIKARGASSAASAASAAIDHVRDWVARHRRRRLGLDGGALGRQLRHPRPASSTPTPASARAATTRSSRASRSTSWSRGKMDATDAELREERAAVESLLG